MYGGKGGKVFQMLLGLELTYPINRLTIKKEKFLFEKAKLIPHKKGKNTLEREISSLQKSLVEIDKKISIEKQKDSANIDTKELYRKHEQLTEKIKYINASTLELDSKIKNLGLDLNRYKSEEGSLGQEKNKNEAEIERIEKKVIDLREFIEIGIFFSNLDIRHCPSCNNTVSDLNKDREFDEKTCSLCHRKIKNKNVTVDSEYYEVKITGLEKNKKNLLTQGKLLDPKIHTVHNEYVKCSEQINEFKDELSKIGDDSLLKNELSLVEKRINALKNNTRADDGVLQKLIEERAVIRYKIDQSLKESSVDDASHLDIKINILNYAIEQLNRLRFDNSQKILNRLNELMLKELHQLGLKSFAKTQVT
ncbi:MAG: hypothetical protein D3922_15995, partial [Candidatus Electrothrix sp. AR1]|nr:hypothetical protein [Candidatus Electrothrix sp. AR1]